MKVKFVLMLVRFVISFLEEIMKDYGKEFEKDPDGFSNAYEFGVVSYFFTEFNEVLSNYQKQVENEKVDC